ncbi:hypothetical protein [Reyranella sp.]|uniref:hypothetical protein n=1 Tax=Reyranella sp. TaxID=1929291 RepID=UPI004036FEB6
MSPFDRYRGAAFGITVAINTGFCILIGFLVGGLRGAQIGVLVGIGIGVLPSALRTAGRLLADPHGLPRLAGQAIATAAIAAGATLVRLLGGVTTPIAALLRWPLLLVRFAVEIAAGVLGRVLAALGRIVGTPLGLANIAALAVIAVNVAGLEFAGPIAFLGLGMLILVLMVSESEAELERQDPRMKQS